MVNKNTPKLLLSEYYRLNTFPPLKHATHKLPSSSIVIPSGMPVTLFALKLKSVLRFPGNIFFYELVKAKVGQKRY